MSDTILSNIHPIQYLRGVINVNQYYYLIQLYYATDAFQQL